MPGGISTEDYNVAVILAAMELTLATGRKDPDEIAEAYKIIWKGIHDAPNQGRTQQAR